MTTMRMYLPIALCVFFFPAGTSCEEQQDLISQDPEGTGGQYPYFWTSTTHLDGPSDRKYSHAVYIAFGKAQGMMTGNLLDVHGAGAQRSDPKSGNPDDYPQYFGPQGDVRYVFNHVRAIRDMDQH